MAMMKECSTYLGLEWLVGRRSESGVWDLEEKIKNGKCFKRVKNGI